MEKQEEFQLTESIAEEEPPSSQSWKWQLQNSISTQSELEKHLELTQEEKDYFSHNHENKINFRITPYYLQLIKDNPILRKTVIPTSNEFIVSEFEEDDPLHEDSMTPVDNLIHRYPNRCLLTVTNFCFLCCRFCTRSRKIESKSNFNQIDDAINYIKEHTEIEDVICSGGDFFTLPTFAIKNILQRLSEIKHLKVIRAGTKVPVVMPQRFNDIELLKILEQYSDKLWINIHVTHPTELTKEVKNVAKKLTKLGIPLGSQTVLLKNINNNAEVLKKLFMDLVAIKIIPRYLYQLDRIKGSSHFLVDVKEGIEIMKKVRGFISGMACPSYVIDCPGGGGKTLIDLGYTNIKDNTVDIVNWNEKNYQYK